MVTDVQGPEMRGGGIAKESGLVNPRRALSPLVDPLVLLPMLATLAREEHDARRRRQPSEDEQKDDEEDDEGAGGANPFGISGRLLEARPEPE